MGWKNLILGEKMPDKDDPKYQKQRENEVKAGRDAAKALGVDKVAGKTQRFALLHPRTFLTIVFGFVVVCLGYNVYRMFGAYNQQGETQTAIERQDSRLRQKGVIKKPASGRDPYGEERQLLEREVDALTGTGKPMTYEDSLRVKSLLEQLVRINNLKKE